MQGRDYFAAGAYEKALAKIEQGLELSDGDRQPVADLNYLQIATLIKLGDRSRGYDAAREFVSKYRHDGRWNEIWQVAVETGMQLHSQSGGDGKPAIDELLAIADLGRFDSADDQMYARAMLYRASMLIDKGEYSQAAAIAAGIDRAKAGSGIYWRSVYLAALAAYREAEADFAGPGTRAFLDRAKDKFSEYARFAEKSDTEDDICPSMRQLGLMIARGFISLRPPDIDVAIAMADAVEKLDCGDGDIPEGVFAVRIEASVLNGDAEVAGELIDAVIAEQGGGVAAARALAKAGDLLEKKYALLAASEMEDDRVLANATARRLAGIYSFLLRHISKSDDAALRLQAVAVRRRLGYSLIWCGKYDEAILQFKRVLDEVELSVSGEAVEGLGLALEGAGDFEGATRQWASLIQSLNKKSEKWLEANYHLIYCRIKQGRIEDASKMLEFFQLRYSHLLSEQWRKKFSTLFEEASR
jgi:tetratricopeptide (TPR) repeat protein